MCVAIAHMVLNQGYERERERKGAAAALVDAQANERMNE